MRMPTPPRSPWFQFSLRGLLLATLLAAWCSYFARQAADRSGVGLVGLLTTGVVAGVSYVRHATRIISSATIAGAIGGAAGLAAWGGIAGWAIGFAPSTAGAVRMWQGAGFVPALLFGAICAAVGAVWGANLGLVYGLFVRDLRHRRETRFIDGRK